MDLDLNHLLWPALVVGFVLFILYRRMRRLFGRQLLRRGRLKFRIVLLVVVGLFLLPFAFLSPLQAVTSFAGLALGIGLALWGANHTRFEEKDGKLYYIPHTYAGLVVTALFIGRLLYRFVVLGPSLLPALFLSAGVPSSDEVGGWNGVSHNAVTRAIIFALIGYYVCFYVYVLWESGHLKPEDYEKPSSPAS